MSIEKKTAILSGLAALCLSVLMLAGCGGGGEAESGPPDEETAGAQDIHLVVVNWVEGVAMTHVVAALLEDSLGMNVEMSVVSGNGTAFSSVAAGDADVTMEAWLPVTHKDTWDAYSDQLAKVGRWYDRATGGLVVPTYTDIYSIEDLPRYREQLGGVIHGIEAGSANNRQFRQVLENRDIEGFTVQPSSSPATWAALQRAIDRREPIVATGWKPHWKWGRFDLRYVEGAQTGQTPVFDDPDNIYVIARNDFAERFPGRVVQFFDNLVIPDEALNGLMQPFRPGSNVADERAAAREWIQANGELVSSWIPPEEAGQAAE